jgi:photosystem II stability/assembly factor-like uncharacterized protein
MNTRTPPKALAALGAIVVAVAASLLATDAAATPNRHATPVARSGTQPRQLPSDAGAVVAFAFDPADPNVVYVGTFASYNNCRVYKSTDAGEHWQLISGPGWHALGALAIDPKHPGTLYASTENGIYKTTDAGRTWQQFNRGLVPPSGVAGGEGWGGLAVDPNNSNIAYTGLGGGVHKSVDAGHNWQTALRLRRDDWLALVAATRPTTIYATSFSKWHRIGRREIHWLGLVRSTDGAKTWQRTRLHVALKSNDPYDFAADPRLPTTLYAAVPGRLFMSSDAGRSWRSIGQGLPQDSAVTSLAANAGTVYAAFAKGGIYQTTDGGHTWTHSWPQSGTAPGLGVGIVAIDPARPTTVYASAYYPSSRDTGTHILRSTDSGRTWTAVG